MNRSLFAFSQNPFRFFSAACYCVGSPDGNEFEKGYFCLPTVLTDVAAESRVAAEECFGRVAAERFEAGTVWINSPPILRVEVPFGGYKESGLGRELGTEGLEAYLETKAIHVDISGKNKAWEFFPKTC